MEKDMNRKIVCGSHGTIYWANILDSGKMSESKRVDVTDDAISAVTEHIMKMPEFVESGAAGYAFDLNAGGSVKIMAFDADKFELKSRGEKEKPIEDIGEFGMANLLGALVGMANAPQVERPQGLEGIEVIGNNDVKERDKIRIIDANDDDIEVIKGEE